MFRFSCIRADAASCFQTRWCIFIFTLFLEVAFNVYVYTYVSFDTPQHTHELTSSHLEHTLAHSSILISKEIFALNMASCPLTFIFLADLFLCHCISISDSLAAYTNFPLHLCLRPLSTCCQVCCSACVVVLHCSVHFKCVLHASSHVFVMCSSACGPV